MKKIILLLLLAGTLFSQSKTIYERIDENIVYKEIVSFEDTLVVHALKVDISGNNYYLDTFMSYDSIAGRETTSSIISRLKSKGLNVIAAVNADFFNVETGEPENNVVSGGQYLRGTPQTDSPYDTFDNTHSQILIDVNGNPYLGRYEFKGILSYNGNRVEINRLNSAPDSSSVILWNSFQNSLPEIKNYWSSYYTGLDQINSDNDTIRAVVISAGKKENVDAKADLVLGAFNGRHSDLSGVTSGDTVDIILKIAPDGVDPFMIAGGWGQIIKDGKNIAPDLDKIEGTFPKFSAARHPRTGIGYSKDETKIYLFVADGRQENSIGVSLTEFADIMLKNGVYEGLNLDGGGSSTFYLNGKIKNSPSDKSGERAVGTIITVIKR